MDIVIISQYLRDIEKFDDNNSRFVYLAKMLSKNKENQVEIITSDFNHGTKKHFEKIDDLSGVKVTTAHESGYPKNVCLKRFSSHKELAKNVSKYLRSRQKPDVCYCAVPSLALADAVAKYCKQNSVRFIVDVQDLWPEAFKMVFHVPVISDIIFAPMKKQADRIYGLADGVVAVSKTYTDRVMSVNNKCKNPAVVFLGTQMQMFDSFVLDKAEKKSDEIDIAYIGTLGSSYDIENVIRAIDKLDNKKNIKFTIMGNGPLKERFENFAKPYNLDVEFTGTLDYPEMVQRLTLCDIAVNPIVKGSAGSVINKVGDYAMAGLPVVNTQESKEYRDLIDEYAAGINCECENVEEIAKAISTLCENSELRKRIGDGNRKMAVERFDRATTYLSIVKIITER